MSHSHEAEPNITFSHGDFTINVITTTTTTTTDDDTTTTTNDTGTHDTEYLIGQLHNIE